MLTNTEILQQLALDLLTLKGVEITSSTSFDEVMTHIKTHALEVNTKQKPDLMGGMDSGPLINVITGTANDPFFLPYTPQEPKTDTYLVGQILLWLAANKNSGKDTTNIEQKLANLISDSTIEVAYSSYYNHSLFSLIVKSGSSLLFNAALPFIYNLDDFSRDDVFAPQPDGEDIKVGAVRSGSPIIINLVNTLCFSMQEPSFLNSDFLKTLEQILAEEKDESSKQDLQQGIVVFKQLLEQFIERQKAIDEETAEAKLQDIIQQATVSELKTAFNSLDNETKLQKLLDFAISNNKPLPIFYIAQRMKALNKIDEISFINLCVKNIPHYTLHQLLDENGVIIPSNLPIRKLSSEAIKYLSKYLPDSNKQLISEVVAGNIKDLLAQDLFLDLFLCDEARIAIMKKIVALSRDELFSLATKENSLTFLSCALASGVSFPEIYEFASKNNYDVLGIMLLAASYPNTQFDNVENIRNILNMTAPQALIPNKIHALLANKLNNPDLSKDIARRLPKIAPSASKDDMEKITLLQGAVRMFNRTAPGAVYSTFFGKDENYQYWIQGKARDRQLELRKNPALFRLASNYVESHCVANHPYLPVIPPIESISQYIKAEKNYKSIMDSAYLLSETSRTNRGVIGMPTMIKKEDKDFHDQDLVCTAPFSTAFSTNNHFCSLNFDLTKIPSAYLRHTVIKLGDYPARQNVPIRLQLTPEISFDNEFQGQNLCNYTFSYTDEGGSLHSITVPVPGADEIYHGINGFKESLCHVFYIINSIPDTEDGLLIKNKIIEHFSQLELEGKLKDHLDTIFQKVNQFMEIDFQGGLPLSFKYLDSIHFIADKLTFKIEELQVLIEKGGRDDFNEFFKKYPKFKDNTFIIREILELTPPYRLHDVAQILEDISPAAYFSLAENQIELMNLNMKQLKNIAVGFSRHRSLNTQHNLAKLINHLKSTLSTPEFAEKRKELIKIYKDDVLKFRDQLKVLYKNVQYTGNDGKMQEILTNPDVIHAFTGKNQALLAAILAFEIEAENSGLDHSEITFIQKAKSQQTGKFYDLTLGSVLEKALARPQFFIATCPLNSPEHQFDEAGHLKAYTKQKIFATKLISKVESALVDLCKLYEPNVNFEPFLMSEQTNNMIYYPEGWTDDEFQPLLEKTLTFISEESFCANDKIPGEVNEGLQALTEQLFPDLKVLDGNPKLLVLNNVSSEEFIQKFLSSTLILNPKVSHFLFDTLHFGVALTRGEAISKIQLKDRELSFLDLINEACAAIAKTGVTPANSIMAEQLALRTKMLEFWCIANNKLSPENTATLRVP